MYDNKIREISITRTNRFIKQVSYLACIQPLGQSGFTSVSIKVLR